MRPDEKDAGVQTARTNEFQARVTGMSLAFPKTCKNKNKNKRKEKQPPTNKTEQKPKTSIIKTQ